MTDSLLELLDENWYLEPEFKQAIADKYKAGDYDEERLAKIIDLVKELNQIQDEMIEAIVEKDPLFLINFEHGLQTEQIEKVKAMEESEYQKEMAAIEKELEAFLNQG